MQNRQYEMRIRMQQTMREKLYQAEQPLAQEPPPSYAQYAAPPANTQFTSQPPLGTSPMQFQPTGDPGYYGPPPTSPQGYGQQGSAGFCPGPGIYQPGQPLPDGGHRPPPAHGH